MTCWGNQIPEKHQLLATYIRLTHNEYSFRVAVVEASTTRRNKSGVLEGPHFELAAPPPHPHSPWSRQC